MCSYDGGVILDLAGEYAGGLLIAPYANALSASWLINIGLCYGDDGVYTFRFIICLAFDLVVFFCGVSPDPKLVPSTMKLPSGCKFLTSFADSSTTSNLAL